MMTITSYNHARVDWICTIDSTKDGRAYVASKASMVTCVDILIVYQKDTLILINTKQ